MSRELEYGGMDRDNYGDRSDGTGEADAGRGAKPQPSNRGAAPPVIIGKNRLIGYSPDGGVMAPENLPVLNAFNEFLRAERRAERRRFRLAILFFLFVLAAAAAGAALAGRGLVRRFYADLGSERQRFELERARHETGLTDVAERAGDFHGQLDLRDRALRYTYNSLTRRFELQSNTVERLNDTVAALRGEIAALEGTVRTLGSEAGERGMPPESPDIEARLEEDFSALRRLIRAREEEIASGARVRAREPEAQTPAPESAAPESAVRGTAAPLIIEAPSGIAIPWRMGTPR